MSTTIQTSVDTTTAPKLCPQCEHTLVAHDAISLRWCNVTALSIGSRACICSGTVSSARVLNHY